MEDQKIIDLYINREERAIHETDKKYGRLCTSISMGILNDIRDSEECCLLYTSNQELVTVIY